MSGSSYSAECLFGPTTAVVGLLSHAPFLERAVRGGDEHRSQVALAAYALGRLIDRWLARASNPTVNDEVHTEIDALRVHLEQLADGTAEKAHLSAVVDSLRTDAPADMSVPPQLMAYAGFLEGQGRLEEALDAVALAARACGTPVPPAQFIAAALTAGRLNRLLAHWSDAGSCYEAAERAAREQNDIGSALRGRLGQSAVARGQGNLPAARRIAEAVQHEANTRKVPEIEAMAYADLAAAYSQLQLPVEALGADYRAFLLTHDPAQRMRILGNVGIDLVQLGCYEPARTAFALVIRSNAKALVRLNALVELMSIEGTLGDQPAFEHRRRVAHSLRQSMPPSMQVDLLFKTASGLTRFGQPAEARAVLTEALAIAEHRGLHAWYFRIEEALRNLAQGVEQRPPEATSVPFHDGPVVREVAAGLQEYAASLP